MIHAGFRLSRAGFSPSLSESRRGRRRRGAAKTWPRAPAPRPQYLCVPQARCRQPGGPGQGLQRRGAVAPGRVIPPPRLFPLPPGPPSPGSAVVPGPSSPPKALPPPPSTDRSESRRGGGRLAPLDPPGGLAPLAPPRRAAILADGGGGGPREGGAAGGSSKNVAASPGFPRGIELGFKVLGLKINNLQP